MDWDYNGTDQVKRRQAFERAHPEVEITDHLREQPPRWIAEWRKGTRTYVIAATDLELLLDQLDGLVGHEPEEPTTE